MQMVFSKIYPAFHSIVNGIKPGSNSKKTDKHARGLLKSCMLRRKVIYMRCIRCSYSNVAKSIRLLDKKAIFVYAGKTSCMEDIYP